MPKAIIIENDGDKVISSNFWDNQTQEDFYLSWTDTAARLLLASPTAQTLKEMERADKVIITKGKSTIEGCMAYEVLFEDETDTPFIVVLKESEQSDKKIEVAADEMRFTVWEKERKVLDLPMSFRKKETLPCMEK
jgi:hypothetical protein